MKRVAVYLPDDLLEGLRRMAAGDNRSMASLIREAVDRVYGEDIEDVREGEAALANYLAHPETATRLKDLIAADVELKTKVRSRDGVGVRG